jgi:hypothetical protein
MKGQIISLIGNSSKRKTRDKYKQKRIAGSLIGMKLERSETKKEVIQLFQSFIMQQTKLELGSTLITTQV